MNIKNKINFIAKHYVSHNNTKHVLLEMLPKYSETAINDLYKEIIINSFVKQKENKCCTFQLKITYK